MILYTAAKNMSVLFFQRVNNQHSLLSRALYYP